MEKLFTKLRGKFNYEKKVYNILSSHLNGGSVLSIGCGEGKIEHMLKEKNNVEIRGVEITKYNEQRIKTDIYDGKSLPFKDNSFDTTMLVYILHHTNDMESLISEAVRVAKKEVIILDHTYTDGVSKTFLKIYDYFANIPYKMPIPLNFLKVHEWKTLFSKFNIEITQSYLPSSLNIFFKLKINPSTNY